MTAPAGGGRRNDKDNGGEYNSRNAPAAQVTIEVLEIKRLDTGGNLRAFVSVRLGCVVFHGCRIVQQGGQRAWVALPQTKSRDRYFPVVEIKSPKVLDQLRKAVLDAWGRGA